MTYDELIEDLLELVGRDVAVVVGEAQDIVGGMAGVLVHDGHPPWDAEANAYAIVSPGAWIRRQELGDGVGWRDRRHRAFLVLSPTTFVEAERINPKAVRIVTRALAVTLVADPAWEHLAADAWVP